MCGVTDNAVANMGPKGLKATEIAYWDNVFAAVARSDEWRKDTEQQMWNADYLLSAETRKHLDREYEQLKVILSDLGLVGAEAAKKP